MMGIFSIFIGLTVFFFFLIWNMFAVVGIVLTLKFFIEKIGARSKSAKVRTKPKVSTQAVTEQKVKIKKKEESFDKNISTVPKEKKISLNTTLDKSSILLYTGAFLVGFAIFIFVAFNWDSFTDTFKTMLSISMVLVFYLLAYLFSTKEVYKKVGRTFLFLASISVVFAGAGIWKFAIEPNYTVGYDEFWFVYSILMISIFGVTYERTKSKIYFIFALLSGYYALISSTFLLEEQETFIIPYLLVGNTLFTVMLDYTLKNRDLYKKVARRIGILANFILNLISLGYVFGEMYQIDTSSEKVLSLVTVLIPLMFSVFLYWRDKGEKKGLLIEGILMPIKLIALANIFILDADIYHYLIITMSLFVFGMLISYTSAYKDNGVKYFIFPLVLSSATLSLFLPINKPIYIRVWDPLPMAITYAVISVGIQLKSTTGRAVWFRFLNIPLDLLAFIMFIGALEYRLDIGLSEIYIIGALLLIPMALYFTEWAVYRKKENIPQLVGSIIFLLLAIILTFSEPGFIFAISAVAVAYFSIVTVLSRKVFFLIPIVLFSFLNTWTATELFSWDAGIGMILSALLFIFFGNLWRLRKYFNIKDNFTNRSFNVLNKVALVLSAPFALLTGVVVFGETETVQVIIVSMLISIFYLTAYHKIEDIKYLSGVGYVFAFWSLLQISDTPPFANAQMYAFPIVIYSLIMAYVSYPRDKALSTIFKTFGYLLPMTIALIQSITDPDPYRLFHGLILITISVVLMVYGVLKKDKLLTWIPLVYIVIELIILLWDIIVSTPWWLYLGLLGMTLIGLSVWVIYKVTQSTDKNETEE